MKATMVELKRKARALADRSGWKLFKGNVYYANDGYIQALAEAIDIIKRDGAEEPTKRFTPTKVQETRLEQWIAHLKQTYLLDA